MNYKSVVVSTEANSPSNTSESAMVDTNPPINEQTQSQQNELSQPVNTSETSQVNVNCEIEESNPTTNNMTNELPPMSELPSYSEALKLKKMELNDGEIPATIPPSYYSSTHPNPNIHDETRITIDPADLRAIADATESAYDQEVGSECMFLSAFMIAFFFNWIGFFASICLLPNAAGKYGALSGLGLSIAKWVTMIKYQSWVTQMNDLQQKLFFWFFIFIGFYLFFRGLINFMSLKYRPRNQNPYSRRIRERWFDFVE